MSSLEVLEGPEAMLEALPQWGRFIESISDPDGPRFFVGPGWLGPWLRHRVPTEQRVALAVLREGDEIVAGLPLQVTHGKIAGVKAGRWSGLGFPETDCIWIPARTSADREAWISAFFSWWRDESKSVQALDLREMVSDSDSLAALHKVGDFNSARCFEAEVSRSPRFEISEFIGNDNKLTGKLGRNMRRREKLIAEAGEVESSFVRVAPADVEAAFDRCAAIEDVSWKGDEGVGVLDDSRRAFMLDLWSGQAELNKLLLAELKLDGKVVAYHWGIDDHGDFLSYNLAHQPDFHKLSPGTVLLQRMVEAAEQLGIQALDASRGGIDHDHILAPYKGPVRMHSRFTAFPKGMKTKLMAMAFDKSQKAKAAQAAAAAEAH